MAPKSQSVSSTLDQPNPASSSTKATPDSGSHNNSSSHNTTNSPTAQPTPNNATPELVADPQPMSKSMATAGANSATKDNMSSSSQPSPYGTRSRNRGQARPNYAEDKDADIEMFDAVQDKKEEEPKKPSRQAGNSANGSSDTPRTSIPTSRKGTTATNTNATANATTTTTTTTTTDDSKPSTTTTKDHQSAAGSANATPSSASSSSSKKRKAASQSTTNGAHAHTAPATTQGSNASTATAGTRRSTVNAAAAATAPSGGTGAGFRETNMLSFEKCGANPKDGKMIADDGTVLQHNDHVYLVCEPPGEPYYLGRIMEFLHMQNDSSKPVDALRINWYYRPKDIGKKVNDTRLVFATMHSDISPLTALRGKCEIRHKAEIDSMDAYRKNPDCFWFEKLYDRYIQKNYDVIPCSQIVNVPGKVKKVLDERWKYILVEQGRSKEFTSAVKLCKRCVGYCANNDSVDCAVCQQTYHMNCVRPPLLKKPSRGFAWACAACSRAQERKLEARNTPSLLDPHPEAEEEEYWDEEEDDHGAKTNGTSPADAIDDTHQPATAEQMYHASLWPYRYLGIHCKPEDALDYDDRIYPRAGSRQGPKHQANVLPWYGRPVKLVKPLEIKKGSRKDGKHSKEVLAAIEADKLAREKRPKWVQDEPAGYVARGEDYDNNDPNNTAQLLYKPADECGASITHQEIDKYMTNAKALATSLDLPELSTNLQDVARDELFKAQFNPAKAIEAVKKTDHAVFKEPQLSATELKKFEEAIGKFGSELLYVTRHVKTVKHKNIVRFYYTWKKTSKGKQIWGNYSGRKGKKELRKAEATASKLQDDVADDHDDSAFDTEKAVERKRNFMCKFCSTKSSRQWRRAPNVTQAMVTEGSGKNKDKGTQYIVALCRRCAELWRRYAIQWEDMEELAKKVQTSGGRSWKRRVDEELLKELAAANEMMSATVYSTPSASATPSVSAPPPNGTVEPPPRKKLKTLADKEAELNASDSGSMSGVVVPKKKEKVVVEKPAPPPVPEIPKPRTLPCAICGQLDPVGDQQLFGMQGVSLERPSEMLWRCRQPTTWKVSLNYKCLLCPVETTEQDFVEPPKSTHKKKTEKEREKDRQEREAAQKAADYYRKKQEELNRPLNPREPLKRTADNNWVHVSCAVWTPEVRFGNPKALSPSEGIPLIPLARWREECRVCKSAGGACVSCHHCKAPVHVECARQGDYILGFEVSPVKGSRRDQTTVVNINGDTGSMSAAVWCKEHVPAKSVVHHMQDLVNQEENSKTDSPGLNALQLFVQNFKQADEALTGTVRKAKLLEIIGNFKQAAYTPSYADRPKGDKVCITCGIDISPKWWPIDKVHEKALTNGHYGSLGTEAQKFVDQRTFQCHKCKKVGRKPAPHVPTPPEEAVPPQMDPARAPPALAAALTSPPAVAAAAQYPPVDAYEPRPWAALTQVAPPVAPPPMQAPSVVPPGPPPVNAPHVAPSPMAAPITQPPPPHHHYPPPPPTGTSYSDWHRTATQHSPPVHHMNGGPGSHGGLHPNHLRDLRPPPIAPISHHSGPPLHHSVMGQPMTNGMPPSPPRRAPAVPNGPAPYLPGYHHPTHQPTHHPTHHSLHNLTNGGPPPRAAGDHSFSAGLLGNRSPFSTPHGSPPVPRDGLPMSRESSMSNANQPRPNDGRAASGASASPSLRNLLS
ncbi:PHD type zinc finger protein with BAH domain-containing protein [Apiospora arundinis]